MTKDEVEKAVSARSDFEFELKVRATFRSLGFQVEHGGLYSDPVNGKSRQFDIRGEYKVGATRKIFVSAECKNINPDRPLIVHQTLRNARESSYDLVCIGQPNVGFVSMVPYFRLKPLNLSLNILSVAGDYDHTPYPHSLRMNHWVGKAIDVVADNGQKGIALAKDTEIFEKYTQAIHSCVDWMNRIVCRNDAKTINFFVPWLIVPDRCLFTRSYNDDGSIASPCKPEEYVSYYIAKDWQVFGTEEHMRITHFEIITYSAIEKFFASLYHDQARILPSCVPDIFF